MTPRDYPRLLTDIKTRVGYSRARAVLAVNAPQPVAEADGFREGSSGAEMSPQAVARVPAELLLAVPWGNRDLLQSQVEDLRVRARYMHTTVEDGWSDAIVTDLERTSR